MHVNPIGACGSRDDIGPYDLKHLQKGIVEHMMGVLVSYLVPGCGGGVKHCWNRCSSNFCFQNKLFFNVAFQ